MFSWVRSSAGVWILFTIVALLVCILLSTRSAYGDPPAESKVDEVTRFGDVDDVEKEIRWFLSGVKHGKRWKQARVLAEKIVEFSTDIDPVARTKKEYVKPNDVDPLAVAINFFYESSFYSTRTGGVGELSLGQLHPLNWRALERSDGSLFNLKSLDDQVESGVRWLAYCFTRCESIEAGYSAYTSGSCRVRGVGKFRARRYREARVRAGLEGVS